MSTNRETLPEDSPVLADLNRVEEGFAGVDTFKIFLEAPEGEDFVDPAHMRRLAEIADYIEAQPEVDKVYSASAILREMNRLLHGGDEAEARVPDTREAIAQNLFVYGLSAATELERVITEDRREALILARVRSAELDLDRVEAALDQRTGIAHQLLFAPGQPAAMGCQAVPDQWPDCAPDRPGKNHPVQHQ